MGDLMVAFLPTCGLVYKAYVLLTAILADDQRLATLWSPYGVSTHAHLYDLTNTTLLDHAITARDVPLQKLILTVASTKASYSLTQMIEIALHKHDPVALLQVMVDLHIRDPTVNWSECVFYGFIFF